MKPLPTIQTIAVQTSLPQPFTLEQLREDIVDIYLLQLRTMHLFASQEKIWELAGKKGIPSNEIYSIAWYAKDYGLCYTDIKDTPLALAMEQQYNFGFMGLDNLLCGSMEQESTHTWVAAFFTDLKTSTVASEWDGWGANVNVSRCLHTCALANARNILEGGQDFYPTTITSTEEASDVDGALTVHQMALLSGMEEMTIRTAISRQSANQLQAFKSDRRTLITIKEAKDWLTAKGRYMPVTRQFLVGADMNLEKTGYQSIDRFSNAMLTRATYLSEAFPEKNVFDDLSAVGFKGLYFTHREDLLSNELMTKAADILQLPAQLMVLRAREAVLEDDLNQTAEELNKVCKLLHST